VLATNDDIIEIFAKRQSAKKPQRKVTKNRTVSVYGEQERGQQRKEKEIEPRARITESTKKK